MIQQIIINDDGVVRNDGGVLFVDDEIISVEVLSMR